MRSDRLFASAWSCQVDDGQLVYLQNLILVSNEAIADAFGIYEEDQDPVRLAESLKQVSASTLRCLCMCVVCLVGRCITESCLLSRPLRGAVRCAGVGGRAFLAVDVSCQE